MRNPAYRRRSDRKFRFIDFFVILLCLSVAAYSFKLFWFDLFYTIKSRNEEPLGVITLQHKTVKRQFRDSVRWDRLATGASLYVGDLIRVAELSSLTFKREDIEVEYVDYQMRRILPLTSDGSLQLEGTMVVTVGGKGGSFVLNGSRVEAGPGTVIKAESGEDNVKLQVLEGLNVKVDTDGKIQQFDAGQTISWDSAGNERSIPDVVVRQPRSNARYLKNSPQPENIVFVWKRINLEPRQATRLIIAEDPDFTRIVYSANTFDESAMIPLAAGPWYWRLSYADAVLSKGYFTIVDASGPLLISPVKDSLITYMDTLPQLSFQWSEISEASYYYFEVSDTPDFARARIRKQTAVNSYTDSGFGPGTWYWHVLPIFPSGYEGSAAYSSVSSFHVEQGDKADLILPEPVVPGPQIELLAPGATLPGLTALRQATIFRWDSTGELGESRFVLSANPDPTSSPEIERLNPGKTINVDRLNVGVWYWTVEAQGSGGQKSAAEPRRLEVLEIPLLAAPGGRSPASGHRFEIEELRTRQIDFSWAGVPGANGYIVTLYRQSAAGLQQIDRIGPIDRTRWTFSDFRKLDSGSFIWQVEAVNSRGNTIDQHGRITDNLFILDLPRPVQPTLRAEGLRIEQIPAEGTRNFHDE